MTMETHNARILPKWKATTTDGFILSNGSERKQVETDAEHYAGQLHETIQIKRRDRDSNDYEVIREVSAR